MKTLALILLLLLPLTIGAQTTFDTGTSRRTAITTYAGLGSPINGEMRKCLDCTVANPTTGGGTVVGGVLVIADGTKWFAVTSGGSGIGDALVANSLAQFAATTSAQLAGVINNESGSGLLLFGTSPNILTPTGIVKGDVGLGSVDNTSDVNKPISVATQFGLDQKAPIINPNFIGTLSADSTKLNTVTVTYSINSCVDAGTTDFYSCSLFPALGSLITGVPISFRANTANTGPAEFNPNGLGSRPIKKVSGGITSDLTTNDIRAGQWVNLVYDGSNFQMQSTLGNIPVGAGDALVANPLSQFAITTSTQLGSVVPDATGSGVFVRATSPAITTPTGLVKGDVGLGNVDNTTDAGKPISTATQTALNLKAPLASPTFTGTVTAAIVTVPTLTVTGQLNSCEDDGGSDAYACSLLPAVTSYTSGQKFWFKAATANTGPASVNFNSLGAVTIKKVAGGITTDLVDNDIRAGQWVSLQYDGAAMQMQSMLGNIPIGSGDMILASPQTIPLAGVKTFTDLTFKLGGGDYGAADATLPAVAANVFVRNTNVGSKRAFLGRSDGAAWDEIFLSGISGPVSVANGGTGRTTLAAFKTDLALPYDIAVNYDGIPAASSTFRVVAARSFDFASSFTGTLCSAGIAATAQTDFLVKVNGTTKATLRFAASGTTCSIVSGTTTSVVATDVVTIVAPGTADATLANIAITLKGVIP